MSRVTDWIDAKPNRPIVATIAIVEAPIIAALTTITIAVGAPWWTMPVVLGAALLIVGWIVLVVAAIGGPR